jgi:hypothetical protein
MSQVSPFPAPFVNELVGDDPTVIEPRPPVGTTAIVYCEGHFGEQDGKTANGLVRFSERYDILSVIDGSHDGEDAGDRLDGIPNGIPVVASLASALAAAERMPDYLIFGLAPANGLLSPAHRAVLLDGMDHGMQIVNGLHEFLNDDPEFVAAATRNAVTITDVRRPKEMKDLHLFSGSIFEVTCPRIAVLGTDSAVGKRTTSTLLVQALNERGIKAVLVGTGQTSIMQGGKYGVALDAIVPQFCHRGPGCAQPPGLHEQHAHPARKPGHCCHRAARAPTAHPRRLSDDGRPDRVERGRPDRGLRRHQGDRRHHEP